MGNKNRDLLGTQTLKMVPYGDLGAVEMDRYNVTDGLVSQESRPNAN